MLPASLVVIARSPSIAIHETLSNFYYKSSRNNERTIALNEGMH